MKNKLAQKISSKLSTKLFLITLSLLVGLMATISIFQSFLFQSFYKNHKIKSLTSQVNAFKDLYAYSLNSDAALAQALFSLEQSTNAKTALSNLNGEIITLANTKDNSSYDYRLLDTFAKQVVNDSSTMNTLLNENTTIISNYDDALSGTTKIGVITSISINSKNDSLLIIVASLQPIQEATSAINKFYTYIFIGFIFLAILISSLYSKLISKPLTKMNNVALKMSNMDFSEKCLVNSEDEIGNLANTLNFLSCNLETALIDLQDKNIQLQKDIDKERELEAMRKDFVASVSHELKTPIGIIEGYAEGIKDEIVDTDKRQLYLETIIDESKKMGRLVANMLELSKLESGVIKPSPEIFNINRLINKVVRNHSENAISHKLNLKFNPETEYSYISADIFQMEQVLTNLITNAIKYTPAGNDINVSVSEENNIFRISVINTGSYIEPNELEHLFDKFYRIDKSRRRDTNSTGLGLPIIKNILEIHNFKYNLKNIDEGVEFEYYIPKSEPDFE